MGDFTESAAPSENSPAPASPAAPATPPRPRRRLPRWLRWTCIVLGILLVLIAVAPYVVAPLWGPAIVSAIGRSQIKGSLTVRKVSLSWFSPITVEGIRLAHPDGTSVLEVESVRLESGLLGAALHAQKFGRVDIHRPHVRLERGSSGQFTIAEALEPRHPSAPHEKKRAGEKGAQPAGRVVVTDAEFEYCHPDGTSVLTAGLNVDSRLDSLNDIRVTVRAATGRGGDLICELAVRDLMPEGQVNLDKAVATVAFSTSSPVDLTDLAGGAGYTGRVSLKADGRWENNHVRSVVALGLDDLAAAGAKPMTVAIHADVTAGADSVTGTAGLQGDAGDLKLGFSYAKGDKPVAFRIDELIDALAHGNAVPLPDVTADLAGAVDFARLAGSLPALVNVRSDARLKRCRVEFQALHVQGGLRPAVKGRIVLPALEADVAGSPVHWDEAALDLAVWTDPLNRVHIDKSQFDLGAGLLHCQVSGEADDLALQAEANLAGLRQRLAQIFDLSGFTATGQFDLTAHFRRPPVDPQGAPGDVGLVLEASAHARQVAYRKAGRPVDAFALTGQLAWNSVLRKSSDTLSGRGNLAFTDAALTVGGEKVTLERLALDHDVTYDRRAGTLSLRTARLVSPALNLDIKGAVRDLGTNPLAAIAGTYSVDWEKLTPLLHQLDDRTPTSLAALKGARGEFHFDRGPDGVAAGAAFTGDLGALDVQLNAPRLSALRAIDVSAVLAAARAGEPLPPLPEAHVKLTGRLDLGVLFAATPPEAVQASHPHPTSGVLEFRDVACSLGAKPALGGAIVLSNVAALFEGQTSPVGDGLLELAASTDETGRFKADKLLLTAPGLGVFASGSPTAVTLDVTADLARIGQLYFPWLHREEALQGSVRLKGSLARRNVADKALQADMSAQFDRAGVVPAPGSQPTELTALVAYAGRIDWSEGLASTGTLSARELLLLAEGLRHEQQLMTVVHDFRVDKAHETLQLTKLEVSSQPAWFSINAAGGIHELQTRRLMDVKGRYTGDWDEICRLIHAFKPDVPIPTQFLFSGTTEGAFTVTGPAEHPTILSNYRDMTADAGFGWTTARTMGLELGRASFRPTLKDGLLRLPLTEVTASGGTARMAATVDMRGDSPVLSLPADLQVLQQVRLTEQFTHDVLSRVNPVIAGLGSLEGAISLRMTSFRVPLDDTARTAAAGSGRLELTDVHFRPAGLLGELLVMAGVSGTQQLTMQPLSVDFRIARGALEYENLRVVIDTSFDLIFSGRVGFNDSLQMSVSVPVSEALLRKLAPHAPVGDYARHLKGARITIPLTGTRQSPQLDFKHVKADDLLRKAADALLREQAGKLLNR